VGKLFCVNESTVRYIKSVEQRIREFVARSSTGTAKLTFVPHDKDVDTEKALSWWVEDIRRRDRSVRQMRFAKSPEVFMNSFGRGEVARDGSSLCAGGAGM